MCFLGTHHIHFTDALRGYQNTFSLPFWCSQKINNHHHHHSWWWFGMAFSLRDEMATEECCEELNMTPKSSLRRRLGLMLSSGNNPWQDNYMLTKFYSRSNLHPTPVHNLGVQQCKLNTVAGNLQRWCPRMPSPEGQLWSPTTLTISNHRQRTPAAGHLGAPVYVYVPRVVYSGAFISGKVVELTEKKTTYPNTNLFSLRCR